MASAAAGAPEGSVFVAEQQTAGRGRGGHHWQSAASAGIYCSVVLRPPLPPSEALILSLAAGLAVQAQCSRSMRKVSPDLKWPNDLLIDGKKFCGILTEMNAEPTRVRYMVVGIGINVNQSQFPVELQPIATSLRLVKRDGMVPGGAVCGFAKIARPRISRFVETPAGSRFDFAAFSGAFVLGAGAASAR